MLCQFSLNAFPRKAKWAQVNKGLFLYLCIYILLYPLLSFFILVGLCYLSLYSFKYNITARYT